MTERFVEVPGARLFVIDEGVGPPIILLHAGVADLRSWNALAPLLVAAGHRVVRYDGRGFGRSTTEDVEFTHRADLIAVMDALGIDRAVLIGNSRGGMLAFDTALESAERVVAVVGVAAGIGGFDGGSTPDEEVVEREYERVDKADPFDAGALTAFEVNVWVDGPLQPSGRVTSAIRDLVYEMDLPLNEEGHVKGRERRLEPPAASRVGELRCPILAIAGELDFSGVAATARHVEANAPNAKAEIWPDVAHMIGMEQPERLASAITAFVAPLRPWR
jgi:3-oxoadipate enol-lactonase